MKVVIAAWHLKDFNVGLGRYSRALIEAIGRVDRVNLYEILMPDDRFQFPAFPNMRYRLVQFPLFKRRFWEQMAPLAVGRYDLLHFPYDSCIAWKRGKFVATVHDVKPLIFGSGQRIRWSLPRAIENVLFGDRLARMDHVLTDSLSSRQDIIERLGVPSERVTVVYPGVETERFKPLEKDGGDPIRPYVLCVAGADPTKNIEALLQAFAQLPIDLRKSIHLMLVGDFRRRGDLSDLAGRLGIGGQTMFVGVVSDERLVELYQRASLFVFPSLYEGFGLPVLEAMACGCPVICSSTSSLPEVGGNAALLVDPRDVPELSRQMVRVLTDRSLWQDLRDRGLDRAAQFSWDRTARQTIEVYRRVVGETARACA